MDLEQYLHEHIPLAKAMGVTVLESTESGVLLRAPLGPNINHRGTVFGGSASALAILAAWSLLHQRLDREELPCRLVIQRNSMDYMLPIPGEFTAWATLAPQADWAVFLRMLTRKGKGRIATQAALVCEGQQVGRFAGEFVALRV